MTDETPRPKRKRRRWFVAGVLLFVVGVVAWWDWPRGDIRLVGKWEGQWVRDGSRWGTLQFHANGTLIQNEVGDTFRQSRWRIDGNELVHGPAVPAFLPQSVRRQIMLWGVRLTGRQLSIEQIESRTRVSELTSDRFLLDHSVKPDLTIEFHRVAE
jgi:hypothetical protein